MKKILNFVFIISVIVILFYIGLFIFEEYFLSSIYVSNNNTYDLNDENKALEVKSAVIKYLTSSSNSKNEFMPIGNRNSKKLDEYIKIITDLKYIHINKMYFFDDSTYKVNYSIFEDENESYNIIIKLYGDKNYFRVLYDELYELGRKVK